MQAWNIVDLKEIGGFLSIKIKNKKGIQPPR